MKPTVISYFTDNEYYVNHAARLSAQCEALGYEYRIVKKQYGDNWLENCQKKPEFILEMLEKLNTPVLFIDVDSEIKKPLDFEVQKGWAVLLRPNGQQPQSFVHYVKPTAANKAFIGVWLRAIRDNNLGDHYGLIHTAHLLDYEVLPDGYFELGISPFDDNVKLGHLK